MALAIGAAAMLLGPDTASGSMQPIHPAGFGNERPGMRADAAGLDEGAELDAAAPGASARRAREPAAAPARSGQDEVERLTRHIDRTWKTGRPPARRIVQAAFSQGRRHGVSPTLILAIVAKESSFRPAVRNGYGAQGLMQVVPRFHPEKMRGLHRRALFAPEVNIQVGTQVLAQYLQRHDGRLDAALRTYSGNAMAYAHKVRAAWTNFESVRLAA